ncbi:MAG: ferredoxin [Acidimicrobiales bacterium]|nr:ferredoxin [Acidimicrobiales bacterium]
MEIYDRGFDVISVRVKLTYPENLVKVPLMAQMVRNFDITPNIRSAQVSDDIGWIICELDGNSASVDQALAWIKDQGVQIDILGAEV